MGNKMGQGKWVNVLGLFSQLGIKKRSCSQYILPTLCTGNSPHQEHFPHKLVLILGKGPKAANNHHIRQVRASTGHSDTKIVLNVIQT